MPSAMWLASGWSFPAILQSHTESAASRSKAGPGVPALASQVVLGDVRMNGRCGEELSTSTG